MHLWGLWVRDAVCRTISQSHKSSEVLTGACKYPYFVDNLLQGEKKKCSQALWGFFCNFFPHLHSHRFFRTCPSLSPSPSSM